MRHYIMRRGHYIAALSLLVAVFSLSFASTALAAGGTPQDICKDLQDNGHLDSTYTAEQLAAFLNDPTTQGYCGSIAATIPPVTQAPVGTPPVTAPPAATPPATKPPAGTSPVAAGVQGTRKTVVAPTAKVTPRVKGARHTVASAPTAASVAPLGTTKSTGSLPFTGAELALFALVGLALIGTGLLLRTTARQRS